MTQDRSFKSKSNIKFTPEYTRWYSCMKDHTEDRNKKRDII